MSTEALITKITIHNQPHAPSKTRRLQKRICKSMLTIANVWGLTKLLMFSNVIMAFTSVSAECTNHLHQDFNQKSPNLVWASNFTYIKIASKGTISRCYKSSSSSSMSLAYPFPCTTLAPLYSHSPNNTQHSQNLWELFLPIYP